MSTCRRVAGGRIPPGQWSPARDYAQAVVYVKIEGRIGNLEYRRLIGAIKKNATRGLGDLVAQGLLIKVGTTGRGVHYVRARKGDAKGTKGTSAATTDKGAIKGPNGPSGRTKAKKTKKASSSTMKKKTKKTSKKSKKK